MGHHPIITDVLIRRNVVLASAAHILKKKNCRDKTTGTIQSMEFSRPEYWSEQPFPSSGDLPNPGIEPRSPVLQADSLLAEPPGKPKNTGVGSLSLLQWIFPTQELNWGLLHCRRILYQLSYQGSPYKKTCKNKRHTGRRPCDDRGKDRNDAAITNKHQRSMSITRS